MTITVRADGTFVLDTVNRGEAATRWKLQGKKPIRELAWHLPDCEINRVVVDS